MIKNIVFDMGGVLIHYSSSSILSHIPLSEEDEKQLMREMFRSLEWIQLDRDTISEQDAIAAICGRLPEHLHKVVNQVITGWWEFDLHPVEGMEELLSELKSLGCGIYLLSNATLRQPEYFDRIPGSQYFDGQVVSAQCRFLKPQTEIYETLFRDFSLKPEECFFVDDLSINIEGAYCRGMIGEVFDGDIQRLRRALNRAGVPVRVGQN